MRDSPCHGTNESVTRARVLTSIGCGVAICLGVVLAVFELVFVGSGTGDRTWRYHPNGNLAESGDTLWTGREGNWVRWTSEGEIDRENSGQFHVGIRYWAVDEEDAHELKSGVHRIQWDLAALQEAMRIWIRDHGLQYPPRLETVLDEEASRAALQGSNCILRDPWGREYRWAMRPEEHVFTLYTYGRDGERGGAEADTDYSLTSNRGKVTFAETAP